MTALKVRPLKCELELGFHSTESNPRFNNKMLQYLQEGHSLAAGRQVGSEQ